MERKKNTTFKESLFGLLSENLLSRKLSDLGYLPRWVIFCLDIGILVVSSVLTYLLLKNLTLTFYDTLPVVLRYSIVVVVNAFYFLVFRTYSGIIRHSSFIDGIKILLATFSGFVTMVVINYAAYFIVGSKIFLTPGLFFNFIFSFSLLFLFRIFVKSFFEHYFFRKNRIRLINALILGADSNAISVANALKSEVPSRFRLLGFVTRQRHRGSKTIMDIPIVNLMERKLPVLLRSMGAQALVLADSSLTAQEKNDIVDQCLDYGFKVYSAPLVSDWENEKDISRKIKNIRIEDLLERKPIQLDNCQVSSQLEGRRVLVTGAAGSIGSEIVRQVLAFRPSELILVDQAETPLHNLCLEINGGNGYTRVKALVQDIRDYQSMELLFAEYRPEKVYHAAAYKHVPLMEENPAQAIFTNVMGTKNLADLSVKYGVGKFVMVSTDKAVNPSNVMGASKRIAEKYVQSLNYDQPEVIGRERTKFVTTRFGNVLGSNGSVVPLFTKQIEAGGPITITHPEIIRYFMTIPEACQLVLEAGAMGQGGEIYIFDMGKPVKIIDLARKMIRMAGYIPEKEIKIAITGLRPGEKLYEELLNDQAKTLPTHHEKIMVAQEFSENFITVSQVVEGLFEEARKGDTHSLVSRMKDIVPEFVSNNSVFECLDIPSKKII